MVALALLLGLCIGKPPEATRLATSPSFGLPRCASSYLPRKQQRVRVPSPAAAPASVARACQRGPEAILTSCRPPETGCAAGSPSRARIRPRAEWDAMPHPLRC